MEHKALIAMSGGVDSSVAALLMKEKGFDCLGITMKLFYNEDLDIPKEHSCCSMDDVEDARRVASSLGIPFYVFNFSERFKEYVIDRFVSAYENGATPNPCIDCNRYLKFDKLFHRARELGYDYVVTGHYARISYNDATGRYELKKGLDETKDQSYVLYSLTQEQLAHTIFPLGAYHKSEVREIAEKAGFINAHKHDSQDICFVTDGSYADFIEKYTGHAYPHGDFIDMDGHVLGEHQGIIRYTIGQRKGLGIALGYPAYVCEVDPQANAVRLGPHEALFKKSLIATDVNLISIEKISQPMRVKAKVRYHQTEEWATITPAAGDDLCIEFDMPQRAITRGQAVVMYDGDTVIGGGRIK